MVSTLRGLVLTRVQPGDGTAVRAWHELRVASWDGVPAEPGPCPRFDTGRMHHPWPGEDETFWLARTEPDGPVVGGCLLHLPMLDNTDNATVELRVAREHRRRGVGRALLAHLSEEARRHGRCRLIAEVDQPLDPGAVVPGDRFAESCGAERALVETRRRLDVPAVDDALLDRLERDAAAHSAGYSLVQWADLTPQRWLAGTAYLIGRLSTDAPLGRLRWGPESFDAHRVWGREESCLARGMRLVSTGAVHDATGQLVGHSQIVRYASAPWYGEQWDTIVAPGHRGHRLGTLMKVANLRLARAELPEVRVVDTWNAESNRYMVSINEAMGFRPCGRYSEWQLSL